MSRETEYQVRVHVIEARDLKGRDSGGMSDPMVSVIINGVKQNTEIHKNSLSCTFDRLFFFNFKWTEEEFQAAKIQINVYDANTFFRNVIIGRYEFDVAYVYKSPQHELYRRWLALTATEREKGIQGYLKTSVSICGPGETFPTHDEKDDDDDVAGADLQSMVLLPPDMDSTGYLLCFKIFKAEGLPKSDFFGKCDGYVRIKFGGNKPVETEVMKKTYDPVWNQELCVPVFVPTMSDLIELQVFDWDMTGSHDKISTLYFRFSDIMKRAITPTWFNLYGARDTSVRDKINSTFQGTWSVQQLTQFMGRILLSADVIRQDDPQPQVRKISPCMEPSVMSYTLKFDLYEAAELAQSKIPVLDADYTVEVVIGKFTKESKHLKPKGGVVSWYQAFEYITFTFPEDISMVPDVILNVYSDKLSSRTRIGFLKFKASDVFGANHSPRWESLIADQTSAAYEKGQSAGFILFQLDLAYSTSFPKERPQLIRPTLKKYILRSNIYQGRALPTADLNGFSDPYCVIRCGPFSKKTSVKEMTLYPAWYEVLNMEVELPDPLTLAPNLSILCYDANAIGFDTLLGRYDIPITSLTKRWPGDPKWYKLYVDDPTDTEGEILSSFQLIPAEELSKCPVVNIVPQYRECVFEVDLVGLRNLLPYLLIPIQNAFVEIDIGDRKDKQKVLQSQPSDMPTAHCPNHLEVLKMNFNFPLNLAFAPCINIHVYDIRLRGTAKPLVAAATIPSAAFLPWSNLDPRSLSSSTPKIVDDIPGAHDADTHQIILEPIEQVVIDIDDEIPIDISEANVKMGEYLIFRSPDSYDEIGGRGIRTMPEVAETEFEDATAKEEDDPLGGRKSCKNELELELKQLPFQEFDLIRGNIRPPSALAGLLKLLNQKINKTRTVGKIKSTFRVTEVDKLDSVPPSPNLKEMFKDAEYVIRIYLLRGIQLVPGGFSGTCDPYPVISVGDSPNQKISDRENAKEKTLKPDFYKMYEMNARLPGDSEIKVALYDKYAHGFDELIGATVIDLENRLFCDEWKQMKMKPREFRTLWSPDSSSPQGKVEMWLEILTLEEARQTPPTPISAPAAEPYELRVIIWNTEKVSLGGKDQRDIFVTATIGGAPKQRTDIHWRSADGTGNFNWRMIFPVTIPMEYPRLHLQIWDQALINPNDCIAEANVNLKGFFRKAHGLGLPSLLLDRQWVVLSHPNYEGPQGELEISVEILTDAEAKTKPAGLGRDEPNENPHLDEPDRPWSSYNPFNPLNSMKMLRSLAMKNSKKLIFAAVMSIFFMVLIPVSKFMLL